MALPRADALVGITFQSDNFLGYLVRERGKWADIAKEANSANREVAIGMQQKVVENLERAIEGHGRTQRGTDYLFRAVEGEPFIAFSAEGFTVGTDSALNEGPARLYWRGVEFGSERFVGREITGYFRGIEGGRYPAMESRYKADPRLIQLPGAEGGSHSRFPFRIRIRNKIPEYKFIRDGIAAYDAATIEEIYQRWLAKYNLRTGR